MPWHPGSRGHLGRSVRHEDIDLYHVLMANDRHGPDGKFAPAGSAPLTPEEKRQRNTEQKRKKRQENRSEHTEKNRAWNFRRKYGITIAQYDQMRADQGYRCAICAGHEDELPRPQSRVTSDGHQIIGMALVVDHCHKSRRVRKLLCAKCNQGIGCFKEDPALLEAARRYILEVCPLDPDSEGISA